LLLAGILVSGSAGCIAWRSPPQGLPASGLLECRDARLALHLPGPPWRLHLPAREDGLVLLLTNSRAADALYQVEIWQEARAPRVRRLAVEVEPFCAPLRPLDQRATQFCNRRGLRFLAHCGLAWPFYCSYRFRTGVAVLEILFWFRDSRVDIFAGQFWRLREATAAEVARILDGVGLLASAR
jgi:hypothetical protein